MTTTNVHPIRGKHTKRLVQFLIANIHHRTVEHFLVLFLTRDHLVLGLEEVSRRPLDERDIDPRDVLRRCRNHEAAAVLACHYQPHGSAEPTETHRRITAELNAALAPAGVGVLDHVIVGTGERVSSIEHGLLQDAATTSYRPPSLDR